MGKILSWRERGGVERITVMHNTVMNGLEGENIEERRFMKKI